VTGNAVHAPWGREEVDSELWRLGTAKPATSFLVIACCWSPLRSLKTGACGVLPEKTGDWQRCPRAVGACGIDSELWRLGTAKPVTSF
jgi:hypothetical protein